MPTTLFAADHFASGTRLESATYDTNYIIDTDALFGSSDGTAMILTSSSHDVFVRGTLYGDLSAIRLGDHASNDWGNALHIEAGGAVLGYNGLQGAGYVDLFNQGQISAENVAASFAMDGYASSKVVNDGTITAGGIAVAATLWGSSSLSVINRGTLSGDNGLSMSSNSTNAKTHLVNEGLIDGGHWAYVGGDAAETVVNRGLLRGEVWMGGNADRFDNRGGDALDLVDGGMGDDVFLPGLNAEDFDGGAGIDTLDFRGSAGLRVSLMDDSGTGRAEGDVYRGFERVLGSRSGADTLIGDGNANSLLGFGDRDALKGGGGADLLQGGAEADRLWGGQGDDVFHFAAPGQGGDIIADWGKATGNDDSIRIEAAGFGGGLAVGPLASGALRTRSSDNLAQDADDRFVFRKDDATLWWDVDGKGGEEAVLLADLQSGAVVTVADILLV